MKNYGKNLRKANAALRRELDEAREDTKLVDFMLSVANGTAKVDFGVQADEVMTRKHLRAARAAQTKEP